MNKVLPAILLIALPLSVNAQQTNEKNLREHFEKSKTIDPIEGIWKIETTREFYHYDTLYEAKSLPDTQVSVMKRGGNYIVSNIKGEPYNLEFTSTDVKGVYMYQNFYEDISTYSKKQAVICTHDKMEYTYDLPEEYAIKYCGDSYTPNTRVVNTLRWSKIFPHQP